MRNRSTKVNGPMAPAFRRLIRADLPTFDQAAKSLILGAVDIGCMGRISSKGHCTTPFSTAVALDSPRRVQSDRAASVPATRTVSDTTPETPRKAKHDIPAPAHQTAPVGAAKQPDDPVAVLQRVREALGPDPRVHNFPSLSTPN